MQTMTLHKKHHKPESTETEESESANSNAEHTDDAKSKSEEMKQTAEDRKS